MGVLGELMEVKVTTRSNQREITGLSVTILQIATSDEVCSPLFYSLRSSLERSQNWIQPAQMGKSSQTDIKINVIRRDRNCHGGGVFVLAKDELAMSEVHVKDPECPMVLANITLKDKTNITIGAFYRQPNTSLADIESLVTAVMDVRGNKTRVPEMIIGGDFNLPSIEWGDEVKTRDPPSYGREINSRFIDVCDELGLTQVVRDPTRENNILDLMLVTSPDRCVDIQVNPGISDHDAVCLTFEGRVKINKKKPRTVFLFKRADMSSLKEDLKLHEQEEFIAHLGTGDINHTWNYFKMALSEMIKKNIPQRTITQNHRLPWVTASIRRLTRRRRRARKKARITNKAADWKRSKELDKETKIQLKEAHETYLKDIFTSETHRLTKKAWSYIKSQRRDNIGIPPLLNENFVRMQKTRPKSCLASIHPYLHRTIHSSQYPMCHTASHLCQTSTLRKMESSSC